jgi:hypothetical protein
MESAPVQWQKGCEIDSRAAVTFFRSSADWARTTRSQSVCTCVSSGKRWFRSRAIKSARAQSLASANASAASTSTPGLTERSTCPRLPSVPRHCSHKLFRVSLHSRARLQRSPCCLRAWRNCPEIRETCPYFAIVPTHTGLQRTDCSAAKAVTVPAFLGPHAQSGFKEGIRRMQCDQKPRDSAIAS